MSAGNRVYLRRGLPSKGLIQTFRKILAAMVGDCMDRNCALHCSIRLMSKSVKNTCGPTLTVQSRRGGSLFFHKASDMAQEGGVIITATSFCNTNSVAGENTAANITFKELGGLVFDTPIRDAKEVSKMELPAYVTGTISGGPHKSAPGEINVPIPYGSCFIYLGDIIVGDMGGVVVVSLGDAKAVLEAAQKYYVTDMHSQEEAAAGSWNRK